MQKATAEKIEPLSVEGLGVQLGSFGIQDISFRVEPGQVAGLLGPNGAAKTAMLRLIMGLVRKESGRVCIGALDQLPQDRCSTASRDAGDAPEDS